MFKCMPHVLPILHFITIISSEESR